MARKFQRLAGVLLLCCAAYYAFSGRGGSAGAPPPPPADQDFQHQHQPDLAIVAVSAHIRVFEQYFGDEILLLLINIIILS